MKRIKPIWKADSAFNSLMDMAFSFQCSRLLFTSIELDVFSTIGEQKKTAAQIAETIGTDEHATERLLHALCGIDLLEKDENGCFSNSEAALIHLIVGKPLYIGSLAHITHLWDPWATLTSTIKRGEPERFKSIGEKAQSWVSDYVRSIHWKAMHEADDVVKLIKLSGLKKMLDLGGGSGYYSILAAQQCPGLNAVVFDYPNVIEETKKFITHYSAESHVTTIAGDAYKDDIGTGYDMVLISHLIDQYSIWDNIKLMQKVYDSLALGGIVVVHESIIESDRINPPKAAMSALNLLLNTEQGDLPTESDLWVMLKEAWFQDLTRIDTDFGTAIMIGHKTTMF